MSERHPQEQVCSWGVGGWCVMVLPSTLSPHSPNIHSDSLTLSGLCGYFSSPYLKPITNAPSVHTHTHTHTHTGPCEWKGGNRSREKGKGRPDQGKCLK